MTNAPTVQTIYDSIVAMDATFAADVDGAAAKAAELKQSGNDKTQQAADLQASATSDFSNSQSFGHLADTLTGQRSALAAVLSQLETLGAVPPAPPDNGSGAPPVPAPSDGGATPEPATPAPTTSAPATPNDGGWGTAP